MFHDVLLLIDKHLYVYINVYINVLKYSLTN